MRFIDEVKVEICAGSGGPGSSAFRREKYVPKGGPAGGDGGRGGHVYLIASKDQNTLLELYTQKHIRAKHGQSGLGKNMNGANGADVEVIVPVGTIIKDENGHVIIDLDHDKCRYMVAEGGLGGLGNQHFATSINRTPRYAQPGITAEPAIFFLELKCMADVGLLGLPNAGKSTLLSRISNAQPRVADYPFTTIKPKLGQVLMGHSDGFVVADIPGLIEGAHEGKGLGDRFLRHIERTSVLLHLVESVSMLEQSLQQQIDEIEHELSSYGKKLTEKPRILIINKIDALDQEGRDHLEEEVKLLSLPYLLISAVTGEGIDELLYQTWDMVKQKKMNA
ncbi:MAG: GTPase ObgE [Mariprofundaceae bacterium]|nr:GTPase ObgE [Mariprofundaceae bacterium]